MVADPKQEVIGNNDDLEQANGHNEAAPELDPDIISALGETSVEAPKFGPKIHEQLALLWLPILKKGMTKDSKDEILKKYRIPENCALLEAPKLNPEISAVVTEGARARDQKVKTMQLQLGQGIAALNKGLELLLHDNKDRLQAIKFLSDSCRILCDLHHVQTEARKKLVTSGLERFFLTIMQDADRDNKHFWV